MSGFTPGVPGKDRYPTQDEWNANEQGWNAGIRKAMRMARARAGACTRRVDLSASTALKMLADDLQRVIDKDY